MKLTRNFSSGEMQCPCCGIENMDDNFMDMLQNARTLAGVPFHVNSGFRCVDHNSDVGGVLGSMHTKGKAADIRTKTSAERGDVLAGAIKAKFKRIGVYETFIHMDSRVESGQRVVWIGEN